MTSVDANTGKTFATPRASAGAAPAERRSETARPAAVPSLLQMPRSGNLSFAAAVAPPLDRRLPVWESPVRHNQRRAPAVWLLGAHGGAGVSTLARMLAPAGDCGRRWPAGLAGESPYVVIVARETIEGLSRAHDLLRQFHCGLAGRNTVLLGLITSAHQGGRQPKPIRRYLEVIWDLVPESGRWRVEWQGDWPLTEIKDLPTWTPGDARPAKGADPLASVRSLGESLLDTIRSAAAPQHPAKGETR
ncbi:hypothetical protein ACFYTQ_35420 [Nocardia sp. NPDC004068]|uniref:hypothetical protein n=1 Tax=Nocardia sp. NPDC004068 TaxID=3364303 RepID=UPI0036B00E80